MSIQVCIVVLLVVSVFSVGVVRAAPSVVAVSPSSFEVNASTSFTVNITCTPGQPIKAFELKLSFNPDFMRVDSVAEGDIFSGFSTFFSDGMIDNTQGRVVDIYNIILGKSNVTGAGTLVMLSCTAKAYSGTSVLNLFDVGVTNEVGYVEVSVSDGSVTFVGGSSPPVPPPPGGGGSDPPEPPDNTAPEIPLKPVGPVYVEPDVLTTYSSVSWDVDGDLVQLLFDWGDGTFSEWSDLVVGNQTVNMTHSWNTSDTFMVRVLARDEQGDNSSWSPPLEVVVSAVNMTGESPSVVLGWVQNTSSSSVVFDASACVDPDGVIVSYMWDFGDGSSGSGMVVEHTYAAPGNYSVVLTVTDDLGNMNSTVFVVEVQAVVPAGSEEYGLGWLWYVLPVVGGVCVVACLFYFRDTLSLVFSQWSVQLLRRQLIRRRQLGSEPVGVVSDMVYDVGEGFGEVLSPMRVEWVVDHMVMPMVSPAEYDRIVQDIDDFFMRSVQESVGDMTIENQVDAMLARKKRGR